MTKRARTILFFICLFLFILAAPLAILYSQGYRLDFRPPGGGIKLVQTGGVFIKASPKQAEVYIDGGLAQKTDFFFGSALIENLLPRQYRIEVKKDGFNLWEKTLEIREKEVVEAKNIVLFPENPNFQLLEKGVKDFWFSQDGKGIALKEDNEVSAGGGWVLKTYDLEKNLKSQLIKESDISTKGVDLMGLEWSDNSKEIYLDVGMKEEEKNFVIKLDRMPPILAEREKPVVPENIVAYWSETTVKMRQGFIAYQKNEGDIYFLDSGGNLFQADPSFAPKEKLTVKPFPIKPETEYRLEVFSGFIFLQEDKTLYSFNRSSRLFEELLEGINALKASPDGKKLVLASDWEIWLLFLKDRMEEPVRKTGEKLLITRFSEKIKDIFWLNSDYLIFQAGEKIKIAETDERDGANIIDLTSFPLTGKAFWNEADKKLYILNEGNLYASDLPLME